MFVCVFRVVCSSVSTQSSKLVSCAPRFLWFNYQAVDKRLAREANYDELRSDFKGDDLNLTRVCNKNGLAMKQETNRDGVYLPSVWHMVLDDDDNDDFSDR